MMKMKISSQIAPSFRTTFNSHKKHQIYSGGRNSTKTSMIALKIVFNCLNENNCSAVVLRNHQVDLRKSVYKEIKRACNRLGLIEKVHYKAYVSPMEIKFKNGNTIYFAGGDDFEAVKGTIDEDRLIKIVWFEELTGWKNSEDVDQIIATFTRGNNDWFMALYSFNPPKNKYDWVNKWVEQMRCRSDVLYSHTDYRSVPIEWIGTIAIDEAKRLEKYDNKRYRWIYLGEVIGLEGMIYNPEQIEWVEVDYLEKNNIRILYLDFSVDGGHQTSATTCGCFGYGSDGYWYLLDLYYYSPHEKNIKKAPSELSKDIFNFQIIMLKRWDCGIDQETIDSAEGALRNQLYKDYGKSFHPVNKGKNKEELIDYSIDFLAKGKFRALKINNNKIFEKEIENYRWQEGSIEKGKPIPDKSEKEFTGGEEYFNTYANDNSYYYAEHTCDFFQYWCKDNLEKLGLKE